MTTEQEKINELLRPRHKVTGAYPNSPYSVGDLVKKSEHGSFHITTTSVWDEFGDLVNSENWDSILKLKDFQNLFSEIPWWQERKPEEMPKYLKSKNAGYVNKVVRYRGEIADVTDGQPGLLMMVLEHALPATEDEYNEYLLTTHNQKH